MEIQQRRWFKRNGRTHKTPRLYEQRAEASNLPIPNPKIGARWRVRFRIRSWCFIRTDSAMTERTPPGRAIRNSGTVTWTSSTMRSRMWNISKTRNPVLSAEFPIRHGHLFVIVSCFDFAADEYRRITGQQPAVEQWFRKPISQDTCG